MEKVWPQAFHKLPLRLPDEKEYVVVGSLDVNHFVVQTTPEPDAYQITYGRPTVLDASTGTFTPLALGALPAGFPTQGELVVIGDTHVLWAATSAYDDPHPWYEVWAIPRGGGVPHSVVRYEGPGSLIAMRALGDVVYLELNGDSRPGGSGIGLATVPITGGTVTPIRDSDSFRLTDGGFAFKEERRVGDMSSGGTMGVTMLNLNTGERIGYFFAGDLENVWCGPTWCRGSDPGMDDLVAVRLGGDEVSLEGRDVNVAGGVRFVWGTSEDLPFQSMYLWDVQTGTVGTAADLAGRIDSGQDFRTSSSVVTWRSADGYLGALDLTRIP
jgi:hypothetical protein